MKQSALHQVESNHDLIIKADTPILGIASQFWEDARQDAAVICYRSIRDIDDLIDNRKANEPILSQLEQQQRARVVSLADLRSASRKHDSASHSRTPTRSPTPVNLTDRFRVSPRVSRVGDRERT
jgi:hypothetical protein